MLHIDDLHRLIYCSDNIQGKCIIPDDVVEIKSSAFQRCYSLQEIYIPKSVKKIGERAFADCPSLEKISVEEGNPKYDSRSECNAIVETVTNTIIAGCKNTRIPESIQHIHPDAFEGICAKIPIQDVVIEIKDNMVFLKELYVPEDLIEIETNKPFPNEMNYFFSLSLCFFPESILLQTEGFDYQANPSLEKIMVSPKNKVYDSREDCNAIIETVSNKLLLGCANTIIPDNVTEIDYNAFIECSSLEKIIIPKGVTRIGGCSFVNCVSLQQVVLPEGLIEIGDYAFMGCEKLPEIRIPESVIKIGEEVFCDCYALRKIVIPKGQKQKFIELGFGEYKDLLCEE